MTLHFTFYEITIFGGYNKLGLPSYIGMLPQENLFRKGKYTSFVN